MLIHAYTLGNGRSRGEEIPGGGEIAGEKKGGLGMGMRIGGGGDKNGRRVD